ncbi:MAG: glucosaminidase domain-containing protein [Bacteroidales bacterium]|nr:glucosaminidase domain-containing protein [Bacteroidales bacterium]
MINFQKKDRKNASIRVFMLNMLLFIACFSPILARDNCPDQRKRMTSEEYCRLYAAEAQRQMHLYGIPASITLAQGMFESAYGASYLAVIGNNHFGIKAYRGWNGPTIQCDDDYKKEPFCKFGSVEESYEYHSKFLRNNSRYSKLFHLGKHDYKRWAKGLKECGYATNPKYADQLIDIIERYHLDQYDHGRDPYAGEKKLAKKSGQHKLYSTASRGGLNYVRANKNDHLLYIAEEFGISEKKLRKYNDMTKYYKLNEGDIVYLQAKHSRADKQFQTHVVQPGESLHSIAQKYGVTVKSLSKRNKLTSGAVKVGQTLRLR